MKSRYIISLLLVLLLAVHHIRWWCPVLYSHNQLYIYIYIQKHIDAIKTSGHSSLEKYTSHFIRKFERVTKGFTVWEVSWRRNKDCNILTPTLLAITVFLSRSSELLNRGAWGPSLSGTWSSFQHLLSKWSDLPVAGVI